MGVEIKQKYYIFIVLIIVVLILFGTAVADPSFFGLKSDSQSNQSSLKLRAGANQVSNQVLYQGGACSLSMFITTADYSKAESVFRIFAVANQGGECMQIAWKPEDINNYLTTTCEKVSKGVYGNIELTSQQQTFPVNTDSQDPINNYNVCGGSWTLSYCDENYCNNNGCPNTQYSIRQISWPGPCYCVQKTNYGAIVPFTSSSFSQGRALISITGLNTHQITFGNQAGSVNIDGLVTVKWLGDMLGGWQLYTPVYSSLYRLGQLKLISQTSSYIIEKATVNANGKTYYGGISECLDDIPYLGIDGTKIVNCIIAYNQARDNILSDKRQEYINANPGTVLNANYDGANFVVDIKPYSTRFPTFEMDVKAYWVGVLMTYGQPKVTCPSDQTIQSGETRIINPTVSNIASCDGSFDLGINCNSRPGTITPSRVSLVGGQSKQVTGTITGAADPGTEINNICTFTAYDVNKPSNSDSCSFNLKITAPQCDTIGKTECSGDWTQKLTCTSTGLWVKEPCKYGCEYDKNNVAVCKASPSGNLTECASCMSWLINKFKKEPTCAPRILAGVSKNWYDYLNPAKWPDLIMPKITQDDLCPIALTIEFIILAGILTLIILLLRKYWPNIKRYFNRGGKR